MTSELTDKEKERALSRFRNMRGRRDVRFGFTPMGPIVPASNPDELEEETTKALIEETEKKDPS